MKNNDEAVPLKQGSGSASSSCCSSSGLCAALVVTVFLMPLCYLTFQVSLLMYIFDDSMTTINTTLSPCEQIVMCPEKLVDDNITFKTKKTSENIVLSLVDSLPPISNTTNKTVDSHPYSLVLSGSSKIWRFHLIEGSNLSWDIRTFDFFTFCLLKDSDDFEDEDGNTRCLVKKHTNVTSGSIRADNDTQYFIAVTAGTESFFISKVVFTVVHTRHIVEGHQKEVCVDSCDLTVNSSELPGTCVIVETPCSSSTSSNFAVSYREEKNDYRNLTLALAVLAGVLLACTIVSCSLLIAAKNKLSRSYQSVPSNA